MLIKGIVLNHRLPETAAEIVLRHWQFVYNTDRSRCRVPCTRGGVLHIVEHNLERRDLLELITESLITENGVSL